MPAFSRAFNHDLFISYGVVDDQASEKGEPGWVSCFVEDLRIRLTERLGRKDVLSIWRDQQELQGHRDLGDQIAKAIEQSACMLVVFSNGYVRSDWCKRERTDFLKWLAARGDQGIPMIVIERDWVREGKPPEFENKLNFKFWTGQPLNQQDLPRPLDRSRSSDRDEYKDQVNRVAQAIEAELSRLKKAHDAAAQVSAGTGSKNSVSIRQKESGPALPVFLAEVTDDLRPQWKKVRSELDQRGLRTVSGGVPLTLETTEAAVEQALAQCQLFVQLLSQVPGQPLPGSDITYARLQHRLAEKSGKRILQWRSPQLTEEVFDQYEAEDVELANLHRQLVFGEVRAEHIEDFRRRVVEVALAPPPELDKAETKDGAGAIVFVSVGPSSANEKLAEDLCGYLSQKELGVVNPIDADDSDPTTFRADFERSVLSAQAWIVVYGDQKQKAWVRGQINEINQLLCEHSKQREPIHVCAAPPPPKDVVNPRKLIGFHLPRMRVIDCQGGFEEEKLYPFLDSLRGDGGAAVKLEDALGGVTRV